MVQSLFSMVMTEASRDGADRRRREEPVVVPMPTTRGSPSAAKAAMVRNVMEIRVSARTLAAFPASRFISGCFLSRIICITVGVSGRLYLSLPARARFSQTVAMSIAA